MKAVEVMAEVDEQRHLRAVLPADAPPGAVRVLVLWPDAGQTETSLVAEWLDASQSSLQEIWDNDEDAIYDDLPTR